MITHVVSGGEGQEFRDPAKLCRGWPAHRQPRVHSLHSGRSVLVQLKVGGLVATAGAAAVALVIEAAVGLVPHLQQPVRAGQRAASQQAGGGGWHRAAINKWPQDREYSAEQVRTKRISRRSHRQNATCTAITTASLRTSNRHALTSVAPYRSTKDCTSCVTKVDHAPQSLGGEIPPW